MEDYSQQRTAKENEEKKRELEKLEIQKKTEQNTNFAYKLIGESFQLAEKTNKAQEKDSKYLRNQNWLILVISSIAVIVAILTLIKTSP